MNVEENEEYYRAINLTGVIRCNHVKLNLELVQNAEIKLQAHTCLQDIIHLRSTASSFSATIIN
jgi:hypothetical protein